MKPKQVTGGAGSREALAAPNDAPLPPASLMSHPLFLLSRFVSRATWSLFSASRLPMVMENPKPRPPNPEHSDQLAQLCVQA